MDVEIETVSSTSVIVAWAEPWLEQQNGVIFAYIICVANDSKQLNTTINSTAAYISEVLVSPLNPFSEYNLSVAAVNINGTGPYSLPLPLTTAQAGFVTSKTS